MEDKDLFELYFNIKRRFGNKQVSILEIFNLERIPTSKEGSAYYIKKGNLFGKREVFTDKFNISLDRLCKIGILGKTKAFGYPRNRYFIIEEDEELVKKKILNYIKGDRNFKKILIVNKTDNSNLIEINKRLNLIEEKIKVIEIYLHKIKEKKDISEKEVKNGTT